jgi:hypothetical protein
MAVRQGVASTPSAGDVISNLIVDADHDEAIKRENTEYMARTIPNAGLLIQPKVSHFSFLQDPTIQRGLTALS